jgi:hypothetical protein
LMLRVLPCSGMHSSHRMRLSCLRAKISRLATRTTLWLRCGSPCACRALWPVNASAASVLVRYLHAMSGVVFNRFVAGSLGLKDAEAELRVALLWMSMVLEHAIDVTRRPVLLIVEDLHIACVLLDAVKSSKYHCLQAVSSAVP